MESTQMHHVLGISDKRSEEISKEVTAALVETGKIDEGTRRLPQPRFRPRKKPILQASKIHPGNTIRKSAYCSVAGNGADGWSCRVADWRVAMGISWMTRSEIKEAIPPAYTEHVGRHLRGELKQHYFSTESRL